MIKVAFCTKPLKSGHKLRGIGNYTKNLLEELKKRPEISIQEVDGIAGLTNADLIHYPWFDLYFHTLPLTKKIPTIITIHDLIPLIFPNSYPVGLRGKVNFFLQKLSLSSCKAIITVSQTSKQDLIKFLGIPKEKIHVVYNGVSDSFKLLSDTQVIRIKSKFRLPENFIMYVGDADRSKNLPTLIEAFHLLIQKTEFSDYKLVLIGGVYLKKLEYINHPELADLKKANNLIVDYGLEEKVVRPGFIEVDDLVGFYNLAKVYIQPSLYEGFGLPVLEAMACGTPVITSRAGSLPEVAGEAALYFDPNSSKQLVNLLEEILRDKSLRNKLSKMGQLNAKRFSWFNTAEQTLQVYEKVIIRS